MNIHSYTGRAVLAIALAMASPTSWAQSERAMQLKEQDPNGFILTATAVLVVFSSLLMLVVVFRSIGKFMLYLSNRHKQKATAAPTEYPTNTQASKASPSNEIAAAISLALNSELGSWNEEVMAAIAIALRSELEQQHDSESYVLTIKPRRQSQWQDRAQSMRKFNY